MKYRDVIGYSKPKKKKQVKENTIKEQRNVVLDDIKNEINEWKMFPSSNSPTPFKTPKQISLKEVGMAPELKAYTSKIEQNFRKYQDSVDDLNKFLMKRKMKVAAKKYHKEFAKKVLRFQAWVRGMVDRLI